MKTPLIKIFTLIAILAVSCSKPSDLETKKAELAELKAQVAKLEKEIASLDTSKKEIKTKIVNIVPVKTEAYTHYTEVQGKVDAEQNVLISAKSGGTITRINVKPGDMVRAGQVLAEIENSIQMQGLAELDNALDLAKTVYLKQKRLYEQQIGTEVQYLSAKSTYEGLVKRRAGLVEQIELTKIKAPFAGRVDDVILKLGQVVGPGSPCVRVLNDSKMKVVANIGETNISRIKEGNDVTIFIPDLNKEIKGKIQFVSRSVNEMNRTFTVEVKLPSGQDLRANMIAVLKIADYNNAKATVIPVNTIQKDQRGQYVMVAVDEKGIGRAKKKPVTVGSIYNDRAEIKDGLKEGDKLITAGYQDLKEGDAITVR